MIRDIYNCLRFVRALYRLYYNETDINVDLTMRYAQRCGPIGTKLLQFLVCNEGFFSVDYRRKFEGVLDDCESHAIEHTFALYTSDFGRNLFDDFDISADQVIPIGSGTIGQVYKFHHRGMGIDVAVKVKHPNVNAQARSFASSLHRIFWFMELFTTIPFAFIVREFASNIEIQLNYLEEARNTRQMRKNFENEPHIIIPEVYKCSENFIIMSYHDGKSFSDITDENTKLHVSIDMYLFMLSCLLNYNLLHCDLHMGNWKVALQSDGSYKMIVYDFGLTSSIHDTRLSKSIVMSLFSDDFELLTKIMVPGWESDILWPDLKRYICTVKAKKYMNYADKYATIFKRALSMGMPMDVDVIRILQGVILCIHIINVSRSKLNKILGPNGNCTEVMLCYNIAMLKSIKKYSDLLETLESWKERDTNIQHVFDKWLEESFGHKNESVFVDVMLNGLVM